MDLQNFYYENSRFVNLDEFRMTTVDEDEFNPRPKQLNPDIVCLDSVETAQDVTMYNQCDSVLYATDSSGQFITEDGIIRFDPYQDIMQPNAGCDYDLVDLTVVEETPLSEVEVIDISNDTDDQTFTDISQNCIDLSYGTETSTPASNVIDYPKFCADSSSDSDFDFEEGEDFVRINFDKSISDEEKKSVANLDARRKRRKVNRQKSSPIKSETTIIPVNEEKLNKATQYFSIDINDIKKYYTSKGECLLCGNVYYSSATARRHIKLSHMKLREFSCPQCLLSFQEHKGVKEHLRRYHPEYQIVDLRTVKKEFRKSIVGGYLNDKVNPDIFEDKKPFIRANQDARKSNSGKKRRQESILLSCEYCDEKFNNTSSVRYHISRVHKNPESANSKSGRRQAARRLGKIKTEPTAEEAFVDKNENKPSWQQVKIKQEVVDESTQEKLIIKKEKRLKKLDEQRNLLKTLMSELNEDANLSEMLQRNGRRRKIKEEPMSDHEVDATEVNTDGFIPLQTFSAPPIKSQLSLLDPNDEEENELSLLINPPKSDFSMDCPKCKAKLQNFPDFNSHMLKHWTEDKNCAVCRKPKANKYTLLVHVRIHSGEKPFRCRKCDVPFSQSSHANQHEKRCKQKTPLPTTVPKNTAVAEKTAKSVKEKMLEIPAKTTRPAAAKKSVKPAKPQKTTRSATTKKAAKPATPKKTSKPATTKRTTPKKTTKGRQTSNGTRKVSPKEKQVQQAIPEILPPRKLSKNGKPLGRPRKIK